MEESVPAEATPDKDSAQKEPARERRRMRVPTSVVVTVSLALLSVWIAPAFARQWDDRQKARELQAAFAEGVASATAAAVGAGLTAIETGRRPTPRAREGWDADRLRVEAKLRAYFPSRVPQWQSLATRIDVLVRYARPMHGAAAAGGPVWSENPSYRFLAIILQQVLAPERKLRPAPPSREPRSKGGKLAAAVMRIGNDRQSSRREVRSARQLRIDHLQTTIRDDMLRSIELLNNAILRESPEGFSTSRGDLLRDLTPW
jgi:hypothetical protein